MEYITLAWKVHLRISYAIAMLALLTTDNQPANYCFTCFLTLYIFFGSRGENGVVADNVYASAYF